MTDTNDHEKPRPTEPSTVEPSDSPEEPAPEEPADADDESPTGRTLFGNMTNSLGLGPSSEEGLQYLVVNHTGRRIGVLAKEQSEEPRRSKEMLVLAPFGERMLDEREFQRFDTESWATHGLIEVREPEEQVQHAREAAGLWVRVWALVGLIVLALEVKWLRESSWAWLVVGGFALWGGVWLAGIPRARLWLSRVISFWVVLIVGVGIPLAGDWLVGGGAALWDEDPRSLVGRGAQLVFVGVAAVLPAMLYYLFDRQQLATLRESFYRRVIELEPKILTIEDAKSTYGGLVAEVYGQEADGEGRTRFTGGSRLPILIATLCLASGWLLVLPPLPPGEASWVLRPNPTAVSYGFLGAYFFSIGMILRRYTRSDLKPKTYGHVTVRLLLTVVLVWALSVLPMWDETASGQASPYLLLLAFMVGIVPETGLMVIRQFLASGKVLRSRILSLDERLPLSKLDGVTLYEQARLAEEGIENIQNLVYYDLVNLMLQTRIPLHRLVDWVDQGILIMHLEDRGEPRPLDVLRRHGIRNASDLVGAYAAAHRRGDHEALVQMLGKDGPTGMPLLQIIYDALQNDEWFEGIVLWRDRARLPGEHVFTLEEMFMSHEELCMSLQLPGLLRPRLSFGGASLADAETGGDAAPEADAEPEEAPGEDRPLEAQPLRPSGSVSPISVSAGP